MLEVTKVDAYEDSHGGLHKTFLEARKAEAEINGNVAMLEDPLYCGTGLCGVNNAGDLVEFLDRNQDWILPLMGWVLDASDLEDA